MLSLEEPGKKMKILETPAWRAHKFLKRLLMLMFCILVFLTCMMVAPSILIRQTEVVTISKVDAPRECRSRTAYRVFEKYRSGVPQSSVAYCGLIWSDHGTFALPETTWFPSYLPSREALYDQLRVGCTYEVVVVGPGRALDKAHGNRLSNSNRTLRRAVVMAGCAASS